MTGEAWVSLQDFIKDILVGLRQNVSENQDRFLSTSVFDFACQNLLYKLLSTHCFCDYALSLFAENMLDTLVCRKGNGSVSASYHCNARFVIFRGILLATCKDSTVCT